MKLISLVFLFMASSVFSYSADIHTPGTRYSLSMPKPANHLLEVEATFSNIPEGQNVLDVRLPVWRPGRYLILDLAGGVQNFSAAGTDGSELAWHKADKSTWRIETKGVRAVTVRYKVYANEFEKKTRGLDIDHAFVSGESVFMYTDEHRSLPVELTVHPFGSWHVTTGLDEAEGSVNTFTAPSYDYLVDCPLEVGTQKDYEFTVAGKRHILSMSGRGNWNIDTLISDITKIVEANRRMWGSLPYEKYVFLVHALPNNGGGVEHINSTIIGVRAFGFRNRLTYSQILSLISHEFFHTWNIKQLRPRTLHPYDYQHENYAPELWIAEGTTSYYGMQLLGRTDIGGQRNLENIAKYVNEERSRPGYAVQSLNEASIDAWVKYWKGNENAFNAESDFYYKGAMVSMLLDLEIRQRTKNAKSLDDVMRLMLERFPLSGPGYTIDDFQKASEECAGGSLEAFFAQTVRGTSPLPWDETLRYAGLEVRAITPQPKISLGFSTQTVGDDRIKLSRVLEGSPAEDAGLEPGDELIAFNGVRISANHFSDRINEMSEGDQARLTFFRDDVLRETTITARRFGAPEYTVEKTAHPTDLQRSIFESWYHTPWESVVTVLK